MPPALIINQTTGFLDKAHPNSLSVFDSDKKLRFLELVDNFRETHGKWPDIGSVCKSVGVEIRTFYRHIAEDKAFKAAWDERLLCGESTMEAKLYASNHPIANLAWLRRYFPERWNPEYKITHEVNTHVVTSLADQATAIDADVQSSPAPSQISSTSSETSLP